MRIREKCFMAHLGFSLFDWLLLVFPSQDLLMSTCCVYRHYCRRVARDREKKDKDTNLLVRRKQMGTVREWKRNYNQVINMAVNCIISSETTTATLPANFPRASIDNKKHRHHLKQGANCTI